MNFGIPVTARDLPSMPIRKPTLSLAEDAKLCNAKLRKVCRMEGQTHGREANKNRANAARNRDEAVARIVLKKLRASGPMQRKDILAMTELTDDPARRVFAHMIERGMIERTGSNRYDPWRAVSQASSIPVVVRGQHFPSRAACAKHFGISHQAVDDAIRRGKPDNIGLGKTLQVKK